MHYIHLRQAGAGGRAEFQRQYEKKAVRCIHLLVDVPVNDVNPECYHLLNWWLVVLSMCQI